MASLIGTEIGKYRITERLGQGGMAEVYAGIHTHLDRKVAVKVLHSYLLEGGDFVARFKREAKAVANLRHPNIVQVYDFDIQEDLIFMVMEYVDGVNLHTKLVEVGNKRERMPIKLIGSIINDIASALDYAHTKDMLHRDIKPSNIMLDKENKAYLTDFGIAKLLSDQKFTATGTLVGTPAYMSPEQSLGDDVSKESDIYSLGVVAFEMLTGQVPYDAKTPIGIVHKQINDPIPNMSELVEGVPGTAQEVINRALAKAPESRFASAEDLVGALRTALTALESTDPIAVPAEESPTVVDDVLEAPTVTMKTEDLEQPTVVMETDKKKDVPKEDKAPEKKAKKKPASKPVGEKKKIPVWAYIAGAVGVLAIAGVLLTQVFDFGGSIPASPTSASSSLIDEILGEETTTSSSSSDNDEMNSNLGHPSTIVEINFNFENPHGELSIVPGGDQDFEIIEFDDGTQGFRSGNGLILESDNNIEDWYMAFAIDDGLMYDLPEGGHVRVEVEYLDLGSEFDITNHWFVMQYDAHSGGEFGDGTYKEPDIVELNETGEFKTVVFDLVDARFANRVNDVDFRFNPGDGAVTIRSIILVYSPPEIDPDNSELSAGETFFLQGQQYFEDEWYEGAISEFDQALENGYEIAELFDMRGRAYREVGYFDESVEDFSRAIELDEDNFWSWFNRGETLMRMGDNFAAIDDLQIAVEKGADFWAVFFILGESYYNTGEDQYKDEAHTYLDQAIEMDPNQMAPYRVRGDLKAWRFDNLEGAMEDLNIAVELSEPGIPDAYISRSAVAKSLGMYDLCLDDANIGIGLTQENHWAFLNRGDCLVELGDVEAARADYQVLLEMVGENPEFEWFTGRVEEWLQEH